MTGIGESFDYAEKIKSYAERFVMEEYREAFIKFTDPESIREGLKDNLIITLRYLVKRGGEESYEMLRMAGVRKPDERSDHIVHAVGAGFTDIDSEMRESLARNQALSDALETAEEASRAKQERYGLVLLDWKMPEMDGLEATAAIRALERNDAKTIPIIAMTANAFDEDVQRSLQVGMNAHLSKPVEPERLYGCLEELIGLREETERNKG